jgi:hypothetical protein
MLLTGVLAYWAGSTSDVASPTNENTLADRATSERASAAQEPRLGQVKDENTDLSGPKPKELGTTKYGPSNRLEDIPQPMPPKETNDLPTPPLKPCKLTGKITWKYNDFVGTKGDTKAHVFLLPKVFDHEPVSLDQLFNDRENGNGIVIRRRASGNFKDIHWTRCGGDGQYSIDRIKPGAYLVFICSNNTHGLLGQSKKYETNRQEFSKWFTLEDGYSDVLRSLIRWNKYYIDEMDFVDGEEREFHHDFGITGW